VRHPVRGPKVSDPLPILGCGSMHDKPRAPTRGGTRCRGSSTATKIVTIKKQQATDETNRENARSAAGKHRADAAKEVQKITPRTSVSMARTYQRNAENLGKRAQAEDKKRTDLSVKLGRSAGELATAEENLSREIRSTAKKKEEDERKAEARNRAGGRPASAKAEESCPSGRSAGQPNGALHDGPAAEARGSPCSLHDREPEMDLRTEVEVRDVQQAVKRALHRELIDIQYCPRLPPKTCSTA